VTSYDYWRTTEPFEDAPLHDECQSCGDPTRTVFEEYDGRCVRCVDLDLRELEEREEFELKGAA
jgi:hypothetical protein